MPDIDLGTDTLWRRCEIAWHDWLASRSAAVIRLGEAAANTAHSRAPLIQIDGRARRAPDFMATGADGRSTYWEVKSRVRPATDVHTGQRQHWMPAAAFDDYLAVREHTSIPTFVVLYEKSSATQPGRWLQIDVDDLREAGTEQERRAGDGERVRAWAWPVSAMTPVDGPVVDEAVEGEIAPSELDETPVEVTALVPVERELRRRRRSRSDPQADPPHEQAAEAPTRLHEWLSSERADALDVLRRGLGVPSFPRYSVLRVGLDGVDVSDLLGLLEYGVRLVVVTDSRVPEIEDSPELAAFRAARLLETAVVPEASGVTAWAVDGVVSDDEAPEVVRVLEAADESGGFNYRQYTIVHASPGQDVVVEAGAGTGKTETMAERIVFLLAVSAQQDSAGRVDDLRADEIGLVTFTREAASQMRERVGQRLLLRQRLSPACVQPVLAWMLQLAGADVVTIHSLAKRIVASSAGVLGLGPDMRVGQITMEFREALQRNLTDDLAALVDHYPSGRTPGVPPSYDWQRHVSSVWQALENNGVDLLRLAEDAETPVDVDWGSPGEHGREAEVCAAVTSVLQRLADDVRDICLEGQVLPTNQLVPTARAALAASQATGQAPPVRRYRYLFVDEFQDTDPSQMDLFLELRQCLDLRLFVVGDVKQGIYRFRGASGDAFTELESRSEALALPKMVSFPLTRNFRSGKQLLDSFDRPFSRWGAMSWLPYGKDARLVPVVQDVDSSRGFALQPIVRDRDAAGAAAIVERWVTAEPRKTVAVLCRQNWQALAVQRAVREQRTDDPIACEVRVGGTLYQSDAARELRAFLACVVDPDDPAALLQLCETRWGAALASATAPPPGVTGEEWGTASLPPPAGWAQRLAGLASKKSVPREDLEGYRRRVRLLESLTSRLPVMSWLVACHRALAPECVLGSEPDAETERQRYARCLDRLIILADAAVGEGPLSLVRLLGWLELQVATNYAEDEPDPAVQGRVTALTVHKAKGLEYDRVIIPWTWTPFGPPRSAETRTAVRRSADGPPRLSWRWGRGRDALENRRVGDREWTADEEDTVKEEARLLYVAMTRARENLVVLDVGGRRANPGTPTSWHDLLADGS